MRDIDLHSKQKIESRQQLELCLLDIKINNSVQNIDISYDALKKARLSHVRQSEYTAFTCFSSSDAVHKALNKNLILSELMNSQCHAFLAFPNRNMSDDELLYYDPTKSQIITGGEEIFTKKDLYKEVKTAITNTRNIRSGKANPEHTWPNIYLKRGNYLSGVIYQSAHKNTFLNLLSGKGSQLSVKKNLKLLTNLFIGNVYGIELVQSKYRKHTEKEMDNMFTDDQLTSGRAEHCEHNDKAESREKHLVSSWTKKVNEEKHASSHSSLKSTHRHRLMRF